MAALGSVVMARFADWPEPLELWVDEVDCETCSTAATAGLVDPITGLGTCHLCFLSALADGAVRVLSVAVSA